MILVLYWFFLNPRGSYVIGENVEDVKMFERIKALRKNDVILVPGAGVNISKFSPGSLDEKEQIVTVVMCSRLLKTKGVLVFLEAAEILKKRNVSIQMWLVGGIDKGNPDSLSLGELERWKAKGSVKIFGHVSDVSPILRRAHIFALPSGYREGLPKALLEGAASGLAIVTTDTIGCRETVTGHNGILLKQSSPQCLADALEELSKSSILEEMGKRSRELACLKFNEIIVDKAIDNLYSEIQEQNQNL